MAIPTEGDVNHGLDHHLPGVWCPDPVPDNPRRARHSLNGMGLRVVRVWLERCPSGRPTRGIWGGHHSTASRLTTTTLRECPTNLVPLGTIPSLFSLPGVGIPLTVGDRFNGWYTGEEYACFTVRPGRNGSTT